MSAGIIKLLLGLTIVGIFFMFNLAVPYFFIESLFNIAKKGTTRKNIIKYFTHYYFL